MSCPANSQAFAADVCLCVCTATPAAGLAYQSRFATSLAMLVRGMRLDEGGCVALPEDECTSSGDVFQSLRRTDLPLR